MQQTWSSCGLAALYLASALVSPLMLVWRCDLQPAGGMSTIKFGEKLSAEEAEALLKRYPSDQLLWL